jgi:hypothetical protein
MDAMTITICVILFGLVLGLRFNVLILYPATFLAAIGTAAHSATSGGIAATMLMMALGAAAVQMGYLFGLIMRAAFVPLAEGRRNAFLNIKSHG